MQEYPLSTVQVDEHPSPPTLLPSSQYEESFKFIVIPSPHISAHVLAVVVFPVVHDQPVSTVQVESHPSPVTRLPSSQ